MSFVIRNCHPKIYLTIGGVVSDGLISVPYNNCAWLGHPLLKALKQMSHQAKRRFGDEMFSQNWWMLKIPIDEDIFDIELMKIRRLMVDDASRFILH